MINKKLTILIASCLIILAGCGKNINNLSSISANISGKSYNLETAKTEIEKTKGLGNRTGLVQDGGMIFYFDKPDYLQFWMKDTLIPLQILFINNCQIVDIQEMPVEPDPTNPKIIHKSKFPADRAIEINPQSVPKNSVGQNIPELCK